VSNFSCSCPPGNMSCISPPYHYHQAWNLAISLVSSYVLVNNFQLDSCDTNLYFTDYCAVFYKYVTVDTCD
jgi:hypothetical protein